MSMTPNNASIGMKDQILNFVYWLPQHYSLRATQEVDYAFTLWEGALFGLRDL